MIIEFATEFNFLQRMELSDLSDFHLQLINNNADKTLVHVVSYWLYYRLTLARLVDLLPPILRPYK